MTTPETDARASRMPAPGDPPSRRGAIALLLAGAFCAGMGQTIVFATVPSLARALGLGNLQTGAIFAVSAAFWVLMGPIWGRRSDAYGRKPFILLGLVGFLMSMIAFAGSIRLGLAGALQGLPLYVAMIAGRALYGLLGSAGPPAAQAYIADRTSREGRAAGMASFAAAFGFGAMLGPGFGAASAQFGLVAPFFAMAVLAAIMATAVLIGLPERRAPQAQAPRARLPLTDRRLRAFLMFATAFGVIHAIPMQTIGFYFIDRLGYSAQSAPNYVGIGLTGGAMASLFAQMIVVRRLRLSPRTLMRLAPLLTTFGHLLIWTHDDLGFVVAGMVASGLGVGLAIPGYTAGASIAVEAEEQGAAIGIAGASGAAGFIVAPFIGMNLYSLAPPAPFAFTMTLSLAAAVFAWTNGTIAKAVPEGDAPPAPAQAGERPASAPYR